MAGREGFILVSSRCRSEDASEREAAEVKSNGRSFMLQPQLQAPGPRVSHLADLV